MIRFDCGSLVFAGQALRDTHFAERHRLRNAALRRKLRGEADKDYAIAHARDEGAALRWKQRGEADEDYAIARARDQGAALGGTSSAEESD